MDDFDLDDMVDFFQAGGVKVLSADEEGVKEVPKKRNGLSDSFVPGKRKHTFTKEDLERQIRYMDIRKYCLKKLKTTKEYHDKHWTLTEENFIPYMRGIHEATQDFLGWCEGRIDQDE